jgi:putative FmdB family regulatory protein
MLAECTLPYKSGRVSRMAVYEYFCSTCQREFELIRPMSEAGKPAECPMCNSEARRLMSSFGSRTGDSIQVPRELLRNGSGTRTPTVKAKPAKTTRRSSKSRPASGLERRTGSHGGPYEQRFREELDLWRSTSSTAAHATAVLEERIAVDSEVDSRRAAIPIEMSWLAEYQPSGSNLWFIHDWGIASVLGYLRDNVETEPTERRLYLEETMGTKLAEADGYHHRVLDQQSVVSIEPEVAASPAEAADRYLIASERRSAISVRPWPEEIAMEPAEADKDYADLASQQTDVPGVKPRLDEATVDHTQATEPYSLLAEEQAADPSRRSSLTKRRMDTDFPDQIIKAAWRRQGGRCAGCGRWLLWSHRDRDSGTGAWQSHHRIPEDQGGRDTLANCVLFCSGVGNCHFNVGHGGIAWSHYADLDGSALLFLVDVLTTVTDPTASTRRKRSLLREVLGIPQSRRA